MTPQPTIDNQPQQLGMTPGAVPAQQKDVAAPLNAGRSSANQNVVDQVMAETREGFDDKLNTVPPIELTFENVSIWAKMNLKTGLFKSGKCLFNYIVRRYFLPIRI